MCRAIFTLLDRVDRVALGQYRGVVRIDLSHPVIAERSIGHIPMSGNEQVDHACLTGCHTHPLDIVVSDFAA